MLKSLLDVHRKVVGNQCNLRRGMHCLQKENQRRFPTLDSLPMIEHLHDH